MATRRSLGPSISFFAFQDIITAVVGIFILITLILVLELAQRVEAASSGESVNVAPIVEAIQSLDEEVARLRELVKSRLNEEASTTALNAFTRVEMVDQLRSQHAGLETRLAQVQSQINRLETQQAKAKAESQLLASESVKLQTQRTLIEQLSQKMRQVQAKLNLLAGDKSPIYRDETEDGRFVTLMTLDGTSIELRDALTQSSESFVGGRRLASLEQWLKTNSLAQRQLYIMIQPGGSNDFDAMRQLLEDANAVFGFTVVGENDSVQLGFEVNQIP